MPRIADWGGLIIGVPNREPNTPPLLKVVNISINTSVNYRQVDDEGRNILQRLHNCLTANFFGMFTSVLSDIGHRSKTVGYRINFRIILAILLLRAMAYQASLNLT